MSNVGRTILEQLGGNKFCSMTGARNLLVTDNSLTFSIPRDMARLSASGKSYNKFEIVLDTNDTYTLNAIKVNINATDPDKIVTVLESHSGIYADMLQEVFSRMTGLHTRL